MVAIRPRTRKERRYRKAATAARTRLDHVRADIRELGRIGQPVLAREREAVVAALMENRQLLGRTSSQGSVPALAPMDLDRWVLWKPEPGDSIGELRVGTLREGRDGETLPVPCVVPFVPGRAIVIVSRTDRQRDEALGLWQSLVTRLAALSGGRTEMVLLDPMGRGFEGGHRLFSTVVTGADIPAQLERWAAEIAGPEGRVIAASDVPLGFGQRDAALLLAMVRSGRLGESTIVLHLDEDVYRSSIGEPDLGVAGDCWIIDIGEAEIVEPGLEASVIWDSSPQQPLLELIADRITTR